MTARTETLATLRATGHRITPQRQIVLDVVESSAEHLDAEAVYRRAQVKGPTLAWRPCTGPWPSSRAKG